ncbi:hypothetical protein KSC_044020 [Ktedonobacter sp. SOSP1-52]|uniref:hypothetical protein n=1 Tax=Ktedonobacter sp. SOSP1-52 TaxID=2778366 RepID=UPI0019153A66|nr:hypothetical protein [Ktedonobacter sp. SOSP1-52]GHO65510.1 hypothetical protein KSC_044020 [Ktedonobacter sp. SOSP1-52]
MRNDDDVYWNTSLPRQHEALQSLDAFCKEWGGLSRAEATRRILIEWDRLRRGKDVSAWAPAASITSAPAQALQQTPRPTQKSLITNHVARVASHVLDE